MENMPSKTVRPKKTKAAAPPLQAASALPPSELKKLKAFLFNLDRPKQIEWLKTLSKPQLKLIYSNPDLFLFDKQIIPEGNWRYCILRCGRRFGKGYAGSAWLAKKIIAGHKRVAICGATYSDVWKLMVPYLCSWFPPDQQPDPNTELNTLTFPNGCVVYCHTSDKEIRGYGVSALWCDELASWCGDGTNPDKVKERYNILDTTVSEGSNPQTIITSTPKPFPLYYEWQAKIDAKDPRYILMTGNMDDNPFLSETYKQSEREKYGSNRFGRQEYYGDLLGDIEGALWLHEWIDNNRIELPTDCTSLDWVNDNQAYIARIVIAVDPAMSNSKNSDETGIVVAALVRVVCPKCDSWDKNIECTECRHKRTKFRQFNGVVLQDASGKYSPDAWATKVNELYQQYQADKVIAEKNQGGDLVAYTLRASCPNLPLKLISASKSKMSRAEPVAALYERNLVKHLGHFPELEKQLTTFTGTGSSPDRYDSLTYALTELMLESSNMFTRSLRSLPDLR